jgi:lipopolysaccharide transport system ATP-binding protein
MNSVVIQGEGLGKHYHRGVFQGSTSLRDHLDRFLKSPLSSLHRTKKESFWALRDVSIEVHEGEVLGLIGRNGSGKTTLLKILSRITRPTAGWAEIRGRVRSLLEVGTGFHGELTGRENAYLSGSILGMGKREIDRKFDEIVAFAEIDKFIDTPVKHYSSGMYVRLAFAVAAHLEPEILLVDEVLAVGDINFQKKCLGKMGDVARQGRTVVLVSHQMNQMRRLCNRVVWIDDGHVHLAGATHEVVSAYEAAMARGRKLGHDGNIGGQQDRGKVSNGRFVRWQIAPPHDGDPHTLMDLEPVTLEVVVEIKDPIRGAKHGIALYNYDQQLIWAWSGDKLLLKAGEQRFCHSFPMLPLRPGLYNWLVTLYDQEGLLDWWHCVPDMVVGTETHQSHLDEWHGVLNVPDRFEIKSGAL